MDQSQLMQYLPVLMLAAGRVRIFVWDAGSVRSPGQKGEEIKN